MEMRRWRALFEMLLLLVVLLLFDGAHPSLTHASDPKVVSSNTVTLHAAFNESYSYLYSVNYTDDVSFVFEMFTLLEFFLPWVPQGQAVRVDVTAVNATKNFPVLFVVKQQKSVMSWQVPLMLLNRYDYYNVSRTLCPLKDGYNSSQGLIIDVSTMSRYTTSFTLKAYIENILIDDETVNQTELAPSTPRYFLYKFPPHVQSVVVKAESSDSLCSVLSVQDYACPIYDLLGSVEFVGYRQSVSMRGAITVERTTFPSASFFIVLVVKPNDIDCSLVGSIQPIVPVPDHLHGNGDLYHRVKTFNITVENAISHAEFLGATLGAAGLFLLFYLVALIIGLAHHCRSGGDSLTIALPVCDEEGQESEGLLAGGNAARNYSSIRTSEDLSGPPPPMASTPDEGPGSSLGFLGPAHAAQRLRRTDGGGGSSSSSEVSLDDSDTDILEDAQASKEIVRSRTKIFVADLARKPEKILTKKYNLYIWNLVTLAIFYVLPVIQLVITYQTVVNKTGNEDICYYNFYCARGLGVLSSFNNVFSNIGYALLGILFIILVFRRDRLYRKQQLRVDRREQDYGIPQHFGVFYAMGIALVMEGVLSACYHVCPSYNNFQFDTAFMYMIGWLCMLKIYQTRHPDINAHAHTAYCVIAVVVFMGVIGVTQISKTYWIVFLLLYVLCSLFLTVHVYYMGQWKLNTGVFNRVYVRVRTDRCLFFKPMYPSRFVLLLLGNAVNLSFAVYGFITMPKDFASYLLAIIIINLLMYFVFYILMKLFHRERLLWQPICYIMLATITWSFALYFFMARLTSWQLSPAMSRETNEPCVILDFYDSHDVWHFLSAISLFLGFMLLLTLEDDLVDVPRDKISVF